jgi:hypothetical protein
MYLLDYEKCISISFNDQKWYMLENYGSFLEIYGIQ